MGVFVYGWLIVSIITPNHSPTPTLGHHRPQDLSISHDYLASEIQVIHAHQKKSSTRAMSKMCRLLVQLAFLYQLVIEIMECDLSIREEISHQ
jgi:hypothetical protein